eukprot:g5098.t1
MTTRITPKTRLVIDFSLLLRRTPSTRKSRHICSTRVRSLPFSRSFGTESHIVSTRRLVVSAAATSNVIPENSPNQLEDCVCENRDLGWSRSFSEEYDLDDEVLGEGSFGVVRCAKNKRTNEQVAVKLLPKNVTGDWDRYSALLQREITHWKLLKNCPQVVKMEGVYEDDEYLYIVQELCTGGDVQHLIKGNLCLTESEAAQIVIPILKMLAECHEHHVCFGDVKPANFMLKYPYPCKRHLADSSAPRGDIIIKTVDFGCSQKLNEDGRLKKRTGTPLYMAPEIFFGWYGLEVDIWAVGMMLYQLISGNLPFFGDHAESLRKGPTFMIVQAVMESELEFNGSPWDNVSSELKDLIKGLLDVDYNTRLSAKNALHHSWIKQHSPDHINVKGPLGNIIKFPGSSANTVMPARGSEDGKGGMEN